LYCVRFCTLYKVKPILNQSIQQRDSIVFKHQCSSSWSWKSSGRKRRETCPDKKKLTTGISKQMSAYTSPHKEQRGITTARLRQWVRPLFLVLSLTRGAGADNFSIWAHHHHHHHHHHHGLITKFINKLT
jgi:hypothetical protein